MSKEKRLESVTDGFVSRYIDLSTTCLRYLATLKRPAHFIFQNNLGKYLSNNDCRQNKNLNALMSTRTHSNPYKLITFSV